MSDLILIDENNKVEYPAFVGNGPLEFEWIWFKPEDINVSIAGVTLASSEYTITVGSTLEGGFDGGHVTLNDTLGEASDVVVWRDTTRLRTSAFAASGATSQDIHAEMVRLVAMAQDSRSYAQAIDLAVKLLSGLDAEEITDLYATVESVYSKSEIDAFFSLTAGLSTTRLLMRSMSPAEGDVMFCNSNVGDEADGYAGWFVYHVGDFTTQVAADISRAIYVSLTSDDTGAEGCWIRVHDENEWDIRWFGADLESDHTSASANNFALTAVATLAPEDRVTIVNVNGKIMWIDQQFHHSKPILFQSTGRGEKTTAALSSGDLGCEIRWNGADNGMMVFMSAGLHADVLANTVDGKILFGGGWKGFVVDGTNVTGTAFAKRFIWMASTKESIIDVQARSFKDHAILVDGGNGALSQRNKFTLHIVFGFIAQTPDCGGILFRRYNNQPSTQNEIARIWGVVYNGDGIEFEDTDNNEVVWAHVTTQSGGTGNAIRCANGGRGSGNSLLFDGRFNVFGYVNGDIHLESDTSGNLFTLINTEGAKLVADDGAHWFHSAVDYVTGGKYETRKFVTDRELDVTPHLRVDDQAFEDLRVIYPVKVMPDTGVSGLPFGLKVPDDWDDGEVEQIRVRFVHDLQSAAFGIRWQIDLMSVGVGDDATATDQLLSITTNHTELAENFVREVLFTLNSPVSVSRFDTLLGRILRRSGNVGDTMTGDLAVISVDLIYKGNGPSSAGSGPIAYPPMVIGD